MFINRPSLRPTPRGPGVTARLDYLWAVRPPHDAALSLAARPSLPEYVCRRKGVENAEPLCQWIPGQEIKKNVSHLLLELVTLVTLDVALAVQRELQARMEADHLRKQQVERARYESELGQRRYLRGRS
jgi:hypothetical protein